LENYSALKALSTLVNTAISRVIGSYVFSAILYFSTNINGIFVEKNATKRFVRGLYVMNFLLNLGFSADLAKNGEAVVDVLQSNRHLLILPIQDTLFLLHHAKDGSAVGIGGGIFWLNWSTVFNVCICK
jgi:hypothetical protein